MSDESLREHERRWLETGDPADEAAWLLARLRAGELDHVRLRLAAYLGSAGAHLALGDLVPRVPEDLMEWIKGLAPGIQRYTAWTRGDPDQPWAKQVLVRVGAAALWITLPLWDLAEPDDDRPGRVLEAAEAWAADPTPERVAAVTAVLGPLPGAAEIPDLTEEVIEALTSTGLGPLLGLDPEELEAGQVVPTELSELVRPAGQELTDEERSQIVDPFAALLLSAGFGAALASDDPRAQQVAAVAGTLVTAIRQPFEALTTALIATAVGQAARATSEAAVRGAVASRVAPWSLGLVR